MGRAETPAGTRAGLKLALIAIASIAFVLWALGPGLHHRAQPAETEAEVDEGRAVTVLVGGCQVMCSPSAVDPRSFTISVVEIPGCEILWDEVKTACQSALGMDR